MLSSDLIKWINTLSVNDGSNGEKLRGAEDRSFGQAWFSENETTFKGMGLGGYYFHLFLFLLQMLLCCRLAFNSETKFYCLGWEREEILTPNGRINALGAWEEFCSWCSHEWVNKGRYFRFPQVQNPAVDLSKSWGSSCQLFSNFAQLI